MHTYIINGNINRYLIFDKCFFFRTSNLRNSQNSLQLHAQTLPKNIHAEHHNTVDRVSSNNQRPQSAYYGGNQMIQSPVHNTNTIRTAQSTKDLAYSNENHGNYQVCLYC